MKLGCLLTIGVALALGQAGCVPSKAEINRAELEELTPVEVMTVAEGALVERGDYHGTLEPNLSVIISAEIGGKVVDLPVDKGDRVVPKQLLVALDEEPFRLAEEQASHTLAATLVRVAQLEQGIEIERKALGAGHQQASAAVEMAEARLRMVEKGARPEERRQVKAGVDGAKAGLDNAELEKKRVEELFAAQAATQQMLDGATAAVKSADARYDQAVAGYKLVRNGAREEDKDTARAGVKQAKGALEGAKVGFENIALRERELEALKIQVKLAELAVEGAQLQRSKTRIFSPLTTEGVVAMRTIDKGENAGPGMPLFEVLDMDTMKLVLKVPGRDIGFFKNGKKVLVECIGDEPGSKLRSGIVSYVPVQADSKNTTFLVEVSLGNSDSALRAGQVCEAFPELRVHNRVLVPRDVVLDTEEGKVVMIVEEGLARERPVTLMAVRNGIAAVKTGLAAGTNVIVTGERLVRDGEKVDVRKAHPSVGAEAAGQE